jgi:5-dehydro-2-deoxygluconokinase
MPDSVDATERGMIEVLTTGRISVDLYAEELGLNWNDITHFVKSVGGTATNVAVAVARLGHRAAVFTKLGADPFGGYVRHRLADHFGVSTEFIGTHPTLPTPAAFAALYPPEDPQLYFMGRTPTAPDMTLELDEIDVDVVRNVPIFWVTGTAMSGEPTATTTLALLKARGRRTHTVVDLDYRAMFWPSAAAARAGISQLLDHATVAVGNRSECEVAVGTSDPREAAKRLLDRGVELAIVKQGGDGVLVATQAGMEVVAPLRIKPYCGLGAGDAFGGALCHGLLLGWDPLRIVEFANAAGAIVTSRLLCSDAMPTAVEVDSLLSTGIVPSQGELA